MSNETKLEQIEQRGYVARLARDLRSVSDGLGSVMLTTIDDDAHAEIVLASPEPPDEEESVGPLPGRRRIHRRRVRWASLPEGLRSELRVIFEKAVAQAADKIETFALEQQP